jgi:hypothetical protein
MENVDVIKRGREACSVATGGCKWRGSALENMSYVSFKVMPPMSDAWCGPWFFWSLAYCWWGA